MSILVTGGAGYIGSIIAERLSADGERVVCLDDLSTGHRGAVVAEAEFVQASILDAAVVESVLREYSVDTVIHCAGFSIVDESKREPLRYFGNNVAGSHALLGAMRTSGVSRIVLSSTAAIYGAPCAMPMDETHPIAPLNPYGRSKQMVEEMLGWHARAYGLGFLSLRYFNAAGASSKLGEAHVPETHLIPIALDVAAGVRDTFTVFGNTYPTPDGTCIRDFVHVEDLADGHVRAVDYLRRGGDSGAINLGSGSGHSVLQVVQAVERITGRTVHLEFGEPRVNEAHTLVASRNKALSLLDWTPLRSPIERIITDALRWREHHPGGYA